jgi:hypothetical protein
MREEELVMPKVDIPDDGLENKQYAVIGLADGFFSYTQLDARPAAEEMVEDLRATLESLFNSGGTGTVRIVLCEILHIDALDRVIFDDVVEDSDLEYDGGSESEE